MLHGRPCRCWQTGRRRRARACIGGTDIFTGKWLKSAVPASRFVDVPYVKVTDYQLVSVHANSDCIELLGYDGGTRNDLSLPCSGENYGWVRDEVTRITNRILNGYKRVLEGHLDSKAITVTVQAACGEEKVVGVQLAGKGALGRSWAGASRQLAALSV